MNKNAILKGVAMVHVRSARCAKDKFEAAASLAHRPRFARDRAIYCPENIAIFLDFHSSKQGLALVDSWYSHGLTKIKCIPITQQHKREASS